MDPDVIAPNLKRRLSGVTATIARLVPLQSRQIGIVATGPGLPAEVPHLPLWRVALLSRNRWRVWHARRNTEMLAGLVLRYLLGCRLRLLFTSASQRQHSRYSRWLIARMDRLVATSDRGASYLKRPATVIMHGIDTAGFSPAPDRAALRALLGLPDGVLVGCYGRIRAQKGTDLFVRALIEVCHEQPQVTGLVMGRATEGHGAFLDGLRAEVAAAGLDGRIRFLPEVTVDQMADWYRALDLYVAPQRWEGFGLTPLEAMACGVPVVAADVGAFDQLIVPAVGTIVPAGDQGALTHAVRDWLGDPARLAAGGKAARAHVVARHGIAAEAAALCAVYRQMLA